jgi:hypothetical protein
MWFVRSAASEVSPEGRNALCCEFYWLRRATLIYELEYKPCRDMSKERAATFVQDAIRFIPATCG